MWEYIGKIKNDMSLTMNFELNHDPIPHPEIKPKEINRKPIPPILLNTVADPEICPLGAR